MVSAVITQQPDLCNAVVASAPLLDMVRYEQYGLGALWTREYGTARDPQQLEWLLSYSPYHHVTPATAYPAVLFTVFDRDTRVHPFHARKMCAALQWATSSDRPVLLRREVDVGTVHGRSPGQSMSPPTRSRSPPTTPDCAGPSAKARRGLRHHPPPSRRQKGGDSMEKSDLLLAIEEQQQSESRDTPEHGGGEGGDGYFDYV